MFRENLIVLLSKNYQVLYIEPDGILQLKCVFLPGIKSYGLGAAAYQLGNTSSRTITEVKQR